MSRFPIKLRPKDRPLVFGLLGLVVFVVLLVWVASALGGREPKRIPEARVWRFIEQQAPRFGLEPELVYAMAWAESSLDAHAETPVARGMMQLSRPAWETVTSDPYRKAWDWRANLTAGMAYLSWCRQFLEKNGQTDTALMVACYRYGPTRVKNSGFDLAALPQPTNLIYQELFSGNFAPVEP